MPLRTIALLTFSACLAWPLLAIAGVQVVALLVLKTALGVVRGHGDEAGDTADVATVPVLQPLAAAAA